MNVRVIVGDITTVDADSVVVNLFEGVTAPGGATGAMDRALGGVISSLIANGDLKGKLNEVVIIPGRPDGGARRVAIVGLGKAAEFTLDRVRQVSAEAARALRSRGARRIATIVHGAGIGGLDPGASARATVEGALLGLYRFRGYRSSDDTPDIEELIIVEREAARIPAIEAAVARGVILAEAQNLARDLQNEPANRLTPTLLAERARAALEPYGVEVAVYDVAWMREKGMGALLGVAQGSAEPPCFLELRYRGQDDRPPVGLVGKGITFDSGGISIKPAEGMEWMKTDMSGGAAVIGALQAIARLKLPRSVVGLIPATENMPGGRAQRPGDVVRTMHGKTIEVINTDAEGRLILSDAFAYAQALGLRPVVDVATLTGAMTIALGKVRTGVFANDEATLHTLLAASERSGEKLWAMPLDEEYFDQIKSEIADVKNTGGRAAGAITAAMLLKMMIEGTPWAHLDIAGTARSETVKGYQVKGGTGVATRTLVHFVEVLTERDPEATAAPQ
ncbi:MAG: leucyl aminopeptidase [Chloroflexota bacterium]|nr:leucyl aminopeptidase [Dehalococcoidia bacterium]MDW8253073.1 leucyl aminopeptidase [Chloroflexota bacterium]